MNNYICVIFWLLPVIIRAIEPITIGAVLTTGVASYFGYDSIKDLTYCRFKECCNERSIPIELNSKFANMKIKLNGKAIINT